MVILSQVLACDATLGYEDLFNTQVLKFNETPVRNLRHLAQLTSACTEPFMRFDLEYNVRRLAPTCRHFVHQIRRAEGSNILVHISVLWKSLRSGFLDVIATWYAQEVVILETKNAHAATKEILALHSIPSAVSKDLLDVASVPEQMAVV